MQRFALATFDSTVSVPPAAVSKSFSLTSSALPLRASTRRVAQRPPCHGVGIGLESRQRLHSTRAASAAEQQHLGSSSSSSSADAHAEPVPGPASSSEVLDAVSVPVDAAVSSSADGVDWSTFLETLWQRGYFEEHSSGKDK